MALEPELVQALEELLRVAKNCQNQTAKSRLQTLISIIENLLKNKDTLNNIANDIIKQISMLKLEDSYVKTKAMINAMNEFYRLVGRPNLIINKTGSKSNLQHSFSSSNSSNSNSSDMTNFSSKAPSFFSPLKGDVTNTSSYISNANSNSDSQNTRLLIENALKVIPSTTKLKVTDLNLLKIVIDDHTAKNPEDAEDVFVAQLELETYIEKLRDGKEINLESLKKILLAHIPFYAKEIRDALITKIAKMENENKRSATAAELPTGGETAKKPKTNETNNSNSNSTNASSTKTEEHETDSSITKSM